MSTGILIAAMGHIEIGFQRFLGIDTKRELDAFPCLED